MNLTVAAVRERLARGEPTFVLDARVGELELGKNVGALATGPTSS